MVVYLCFMTLLGVFPQAVIAAAQPAASGISAPVIAIIDTGIDPSPRFAEIPIRHFDARSNGSVIEVPVSGSTMNLASRHGTWVSSVLFSNLKEPSQILSYRVDLSCPTDNCTIGANSIARAALDAESRGATIIQISAYGALGKDVEAVLTGIANRGTFIVMCAGNEGGLTKLLDLAKANRERIFIVGGLDGRGHKLSFSARDDGSDVLHWKRGDNIMAYGRSGHMRRVDGTSYSASLMTADIINSMKYRVPARPAFQVASADVPKPAALVSATAFEIPSTVKVDLAASGEISIDRLTQSEVARLRSRAIRPDQQYEVPELSEQQYLSSLQPVVAPVVTKQVTDPSGTALPISVERRSTPSLKSRAIRPNL